MLHVWLPMAIPLKVANGQWPKAYVCEIAWFVYLFINKFKELGLIRRINSLKETSPSLSYVYYNKNIIKNF